MASTGCVVHVKPSFTRTVTAGRQSGAVVYYVARAISGVYSPGINSTSSARDTTLPAARMPIGYAEVNGQRVPVYVDANAWYRWMSAVWDRIGGFTGERLADVVAAVEANQAATAQTTQQVSAVAQQAQANAEVLLVVRDVIVDNALTGAGQIPRPDLELSSIP
jgi:hypothetical protein